LTLIFDPESYFSIPTQPDTRVRKIDTPRSKRFDYVDFLYLMHNMSDVTSVAVILDKYSIDLLAKQTTRQRQP